MPYLHGMGGEVFYFSKNEHLGGWNTTVIKVIKKPYDHDYMHIFTALALFSIKSMTDDSRPRT